MKKIKIKKKRYRSRIEGLSDSAGHSEHGLLFKCDIKPKTVSRPENEYMNLQLIINKYNIFLGFQLNKGSS
jgi:hypothetical protein